MATSSGSEGKNAAALHLVQDLVGHKERVWHASWSPDGRLLATCGADKNVRLWRMTVKPAAAAVQLGSGNDKSGNDDDDDDSVKSGHVSGLSSGDKNGNDNAEYQFECQEVLGTEHSRTVRCVEWHPSGEMFACASFDGSTSVWKKDSDDGVFDCISNLEGHENEVKSLSWDSTGTYLATCGRDKTVWIWELQDLEFECISICQGHTQDVKSVRWHPSKPIIASASYDDTVKFWAEELDDWNCVDTLHGHSSTVWNLAFRPISLNKKSGDEMMVTTGDDCKLITWRLHENNGEKSAEHEGDDDDDDDEELNITVQQKELNITGGKHQEEDTDAEHDPMFAKAFEWKQVDSVVAHTRTAYSCDWSQNNVIASGAADDSLAFFDSSLKPLLTHKNAHSMDINCVKWNPHPLHAHLLVSTSDDGTVKIWKFTN